MKNKYYIDGNLVRTSARVYTHAVLRNGEVIACSGNLQLAQKEMWYWLKRCDTAIDRSRKAVSAIDAGKSYFTIEGRRGRYRVEADPAKRAQYLDDIERLEKEKTVYSIRELEIESNPT